jgi:hypothetical protein
MIKKINEIIADSSFMIRTLIETPKKVKHKITFHVV